MDRDYAAEIEGLKKDIAEIRELLAGGRKKEAVTTRSTEMSGEAKAAIDELKKFAEETDNGMGVVSYHGFYMSESPESAQESIWGTAHSCVKDLISMPSEKISIVLSSLGNQQRWEMLCELLKRPMTVAQIMEMFDMKTSGKAYHHLKSLIAADLLEESKHHEKGTYSVKGHRVQGIIMIMAGVSDLIDTYYSKGEWNQ